MNFNFLVKKKGWGKTKMPFDRGIEKILKDGSRLHLHNEKEKYPHIDLYAPSRNPVMHFIVDFIIGYLLASKDTPILREWTQRYKIIKFRRRLIARRKIKERIQTKILK